MLNRSISRREVLRRAGCGCGMLGLATLLNDESVAAATGGADPLKPARPHFRPRAKHVIWLFINGGPSHVDTWDFKPKLAQYNGKSIRTFDPKFKNTTGFFKNAVGNVMQSPFKFTPRGDCGKMVSEIFPQPRRTRRSYGVHPLGVQRIEQPFAGVVHDELRDAPNGVPVCWVVDHIRARKRKPQPSGFRRDERPQGPRSAEGACGELGDRFSSGGLSRHPTFVRKGSRLKTWSRRVA